MGNFPHLDKAKQALRPQRAMQFAWAGEPIHNIERWAADRGEQMVEFLAVLDYVDYPPFPFAGADGAPRVVHDEYEGAMPESFFDSLIVCQASPFGSYRYKELRRRAPKDVSVNG